MIVQIYETQNAKEAETLVSVGVDHIGVLVGNGDYAREFSPEHANEILRGITAPTKKVILSLSKNLKDIIEIVNKTRPDILHLGTKPNSLSPADVQSLKKQFPNLKVMRSIPVRDDDSVEVAKGYEGIADYLLLDTQKMGDTQVGATGETHNWNVSKRVVESVKIPVILAGGLGVDNVADAIKQVHPCGVDSKTKTDKIGSHEKDMDKVKRFAEIAKSTLG